MGREIRYAARSAGGNDNGDGGRGPTTLVDVTTPRTVRRDLPCPRPGAHPHHNLATAVAAVDAMAERGRIRAPEDESPRARLAATRWPGRLELTPRARDPAGPPVLLFAAMSDKDVSGMLAPLPADWPLVLTGTDSRQAADPTTLHDLLSPGRRGPCVTAEDSPSALRRAAELAGPGGLIVVLGLLRLIGETGTALAPRPE